MKTPIKLDTKLLRRLPYKKIMFLVGITSLLISLLCFYSISNRELRFFLGDHLYIFLNDRTTILLSTSIAFISFSLLYLQSGEKKSKDDTSYNERKIQSLNKEIDQLKSIIDSKNDIFLNNEDKNEIKEKIINKLTMESISEVFRHKVSEIKDDLENEFRFTTALDSSYKIITRLKREIQDLRLRTNINLMVGLTITFAGLWLLWSTVTIIDSSDLLRQLASEGNESNYKFLKNLIIPIVPRVLLVIFIEIFSYFFLRLYKQGLSEIKFFQNELTSIESKISAIYFSFVTNEKETLRESILNLSKNERNIFSTNKNEDKISETDLLNKLSELTNRIIKDKQ